MKRANSISIVSLVFVGMLVCGLNSRECLATVLAEWTFEASLPAGTGSANGPYSAEGGVQAGIASPASGLHANAATSWSSPTGNGSVHSYSSNNWAVGDYYQFCTSTVGYGGITLEWDQTSSNTGPRDFVLQYSVNGSAYTQFGPAYVVLANGSPNPLWTIGTYQAAYHYSVDLSGVAALENATTVCFRLVNISTVSANGGTVAPTGGDRVDNVVLDGIFVPTGACCIDIYTCNMNVTEAACTGQNGTWQGAGTLCNSATCCTDPCNSDCPNFDPCDCDPSGWSPPADPCVLECPDCLTTTNEGEPDCGPGYVDTTNGGCEATPPVFTPISCGEIICGHAGNFTRSYPCDTPADCPKGEPCTGAGGSCVGPVVNNRDEDWYRIVATESCDVAWRVTAEFEVSVSVLDGTGGCPGVVLGTATATACTAAAMYVSVVAGNVYWLGVAPVALSGVPCDAKYLAHLDCCTHTEAIYDYIETDLGFVADRYPQFDTNLDTWYPFAPCDPVIDDNEPFEIPDVTQALADMGITTSPEEIAATLEVWEKLICDHEVNTPDPLPTALPVSGPYTPPPNPHCTRQSCNYVFGGRDIIFVHGIRVTPLKHLLLGGPPLWPAGALTTWHSPINLNQPAYYAHADNHEFYDWRPFGGTYGYWKNGADDYWKIHIKKFLRDRGMMNRYLVVCYPATERLDVGIQAVLSQIADAMRFGTGVVDPAIDPDKPTNTAISDFGTPSFVVVSHSQGGPVTSAALSAASSQSTYYRSNLAAEFIPDYCKAHVTFHAAFSGSRIATALLVFFESTQYGIDLSPPGIQNWTCPVVDQIFNLFGLNGQIPNPCNIISPGDVLTHTNVVDLCPPIMQLKWHKYIKTSPVPTLTVVSGHPTYMYPLKRILIPGFDDGAVNINSQVASPNLSMFWPSLFDPAAGWKTLGWPPWAMTIRIPGFLMVFDRGVWNNTPLRASFFYLDQHTERLICGGIGMMLYPFDVASGATPYVSPTGMVQPVSKIRTSFFNVFNPEQRLGKHYSFIQSTATHFDATPSLPSNGTVGYPYYPNYRDSFGAINNEETRVLTDEAVYDPRPMPYTGGMLGANFDNQPLLTHADVPKLKTIVRGKKKRNGTEWRWKREYDLLEGWETKHECDYVYESVLRERVNGCTGPFPDCNENGIDDVCEVANGYDCNGNDVPDNCDIIFGTSQDSNSNGVPDECDPCVRPPSGMVGWWPLDETPITSVAHDITPAPKANGTPLGSPIPVTGHVGGSYSFDGVNDFVDVPNAAKLNFGTGEFSIDAWIRTTASSGIQSIVDKRVPNGTSAIGYTLFLSNGQLGFQIADSTGHSNFVASGNIADGQYHHVAACVGPRNSTTGLKLFVDTVATTFNPMARVGSVTNIANLRIGRHSLDGSHFSGIIDEVELFNRALPQSAISAIFASGSHGKCKERCYVPRYTTFCRGETVGTFSVTVFNDSSSTQSYTVTPAGMSGGVGCSLNIANLVFTPFSQQDVTLAPLTSHVLSFSIPNPFTAAQQTACICVTVTNQTTGNAFNCCGKLIDRRDLCYSITGPITACPSCLIEMTLSEPVVVDGDVTNTDLPGGPVPYQIEVLDNDTGLPAQDLHLNGNPPGTLVTGAMNLPAPDGSVPLSVEVTLDAFDSFQLYDLVISTDVDGDGQYEPLRAFGMAPRAYRRGDMNCDDLVNFLDVGPFVTALLDVAGYQAQFPNCDQYGADFNIDGSTDALDIQLYVRVLLNP